MTARHDNLTIGLHEAAPKHHVEQWRRGGGAQTLSLRLVVRIWDRAALLPVSLKSTNELHLPCYTLQGAFHFGTLYLTSANKAGALWQKGTTLAGLLVQDFIVQQTAQMMKEALALRSEQLRHGFCWKPPAARKCRTCKHNSISLFEEQQDTAMQHHDGISRLLGIASTQQHGSAPS